MIHFLTFLLMILGTWILWSGHLEFLPMIFGGFSCLLVVYLARRMKLLDGESWPISIIGKLPLYWLWLFWEIIKSNIDVARRILSPSLPIEPRLFELSLSFQSNLGRVVYANSITLTPGTVTTKLSVETIEVHSLSGESERELRDGQMSAKVLCLEKNLT